MTYSTSGVHVSLQRDAFSLLHLYKKRETYECIEFFCFFIHIVFAHVMVFAYNFRKRFRTLILQTILVICCCMSVSHAVFVHWLHAFSSHVILTHCSHLQFPISIRTWSKCQKVFSDISSKTRAKKTPREISERTQCAITTCEGVTGQSAKATWEQRLQS